MLEILRRRQNRGSTMSDLQNNEDRVLIQAGNWQPSRQFSEQVFLM